MKCTNCGMEMDANDRYCGNCGAQVVEPTPVVESASKMDQTTVLDQEVYQKTVESRTGATASARPVAPMLKLPTERKMWKMIVFGILTLGIYPCVVYSKLPDELNMAASRYDGQRTTNYYVCMMLTACTLGIYGFYWMHTLSKRIGTEVKRRGYEYKFGAGTYWLWGVLGSLIIVGSFVYLHKLMKCMNMINESYNYYG